MQLNLIHWLSLLATLLMVMTLGFYAACQVKSSDDFSLGGRSSGIMIISGAITGTVVGGAATLGTAQLAYSVGLSAWWFTLGAGIGFIIMGLFYAHPLRSSCLETIPQFLVVHYGKAAGPITSLTSSVGIFFSIVASMLSAIRLTSVSFGISSWEAAILTILIVIVYVCWGGVLGAGLVGVLKVAIIYVTLLIAGGISFTAMGGLAGLRESFPPFPWFSLVGRGLSTDLGNALSVLVGILTTQTYVQAIYAAQDVRIARIGVLTAACMTIPVGLPSVLIGMYMRAQHPNIAPIDALPMYVIHNLPAWLGGIALGGLLLSSLGSIAGLALGVGTMLSRDICAGVFGCNAGKLLWINRIAVLIITTGAAVFAVGNMQSVILQWNYLSMGLRGAGIFLPLTLAVFFPGRLPSRWAIVSMLGGTGTAIFWSIVCPGMNPLPPSLIVSAVIVLIGVAAGQTFLSFRH